MSLGETMMNWLRRVEADQNLQGIGQLDDTIMDDTQRRWFRRQDLTPTLDTGYYDPATERYVLGIAPPSLADAASIVTDTQASTGAAAGTLTCPAGHAYKVVYVSFHNSTRAYTYTLVYTPSGGVAATILTRGTGVAATERQQLVGGASSGSLGMVNTQWMQAGDTLVITNSNYVGGDAVSHVFVFEDYTV